ncbi:uncharacterized protein F54H12.2-like [Oculina patagonica]
MINPALQVFQVPPTDTSIDGYRMITMYPINTGINPMEFVVPAVDEYVDLSRSYFTMKLSLKKSNGGNIVTGTNLWPVPNLAHSLIKQVTVNLNGVLISHQTDTYAYKAFLETLLNYDKQEAETILKPQGWYQAIDFPEQWTANNIDTTSNTGAGHTDYQALTANHKSALALAKAEKANYVEGKEHCLIFQPHHEAFQMGKVLVPDVEIKIRFFFNSADFFMNGVAERGRLDQDDIKITFHLCQLRLSDSIYKELSVTRHNKRQLASYPVVRSEIRVFSHPANILEFDEGNLFHGKVPDRLIVGLLHNKAFNGTVDYHPFAFQKFGVKSIRQSVRREEYPYETLELNYNNGDKDLAGYFRFLQASGAWGKKQPSMIAFSEWGHRKNCTLFMFDNVANGLADSPNLNPRQEGDVRIIIQFGAPTDHVINVVMYAEFENTLEVDPNGAVLYDVYRR